MPPGSPGPAAPVQILWSPLGPGLEQEQKGAEWLQSQGTKFTVLFPRKQVCFCLLLEPNEHSHNSNSQVSTESLTQTLI